MLSRLGVVAAFVGLLAGCGAAAEDGDSSTADLSGAAAVRMNQFQGKATHNSYHKAEWFMPVTALRYTLAPLDKQLGEEGVRAFELDLQYDDGHFKVHHIDWIDSASTCPNFTDCLKTLKKWSDAHPTHQPLFIQLENKDGFDAAKADAYHAALDADILSVWPRERIVTPDDVKGNAPTLRDAVTTNGWPTMDSARGKIVFYLEPDAGRRTYYTHGDHDLDGRLAFVNSGLDAPYAAISIMDDPIAKQAQIQAAVHAGFIVRTRADADVKEPKKNDHTREQAAWTSGAQLVSTDFPAKTKDYDYFVTTPGGTTSTASRCNPLIAPAGCTNDDVEKL